MPLCFVLLDKNRAQAMGSFLVVSEQLHQAWLHVLLWLCRSYEDVYGDPGSPLPRRTKAGTYILAKVGGSW
jgi:hypothetical protein